MSEPATARVEPGYGPVLLVLVSAIFWGLWWVPVRLCEALGLGGVWPNLGINLGALFGLAALAAFSRSSSKLGGAALLGSVLIGMAVALYGAALSLTDVARAVLLFYLAPAWSTLIEVTFLGQRWHWKRLPPLLLSFAGMIVVLRGEIALGNGGIGDLAALFSGIAWSAGAALVFSTTSTASVEEEGGVPRLALAVMLSAVVTSTVMLPLNWQGWPAIDSSDVGLAVLLALGAGVIYLAPIIGVTLWGAKRLLPATISFLLAAEILSGITSSALFLDEPFGLWELTGTVMIVAGVIVHISLGDGNG
ncbi:MAG: DMT family transporter [Alphaproteobacteria bacterium]|nr:DMT family transporter [Alphaproteobacteria bacterium]